MTDKTKAKAPKMVRVPGITPTCTIEISYVYP